VAEDSPIAQTVNLIIEYGVKAGASDVHIEPRENYVLIRYRVDGILKEANKLPKKVLGALVSRIKILSNLKIDERRMPQDGRFKVQVSDQIYALRVSTLPIVDGEKVVMRILNESAKAATLEELGYWGIALKTINKAIVQPHGMILVTGPTGSGKSTSLFSILSMLNKPMVNISTVEDPVEYRIPGTNQTQVNPIAGMTFVNGLRALLRQDPNIIMVGEIRDSETANLGVQAALTGHLVFSTLHTNNAATCLPRLLDMGIEPFLIASTVRAIVGQRLVRRLCVDCREVYEPDPVVLKQIAETFHINDTGVMKHIHELEKEALEGGIGRTNASKTNKESPAELSTTESKIVKLWKVHEEGCENCGHVGYKGRMGIYEVLGSSQAIQKLIVSNSTSEGIQEQAEKDGMIIMQIDGFIKALRGQTTIEEILRVTTEK
jgi:type IV pilus assembly protein PilB